MKETDKAYIAGLMDGEAYIGIKRVHTRYNGRVNPAYHERIQIRMVDEEAIRFIAEKLGGNYYKEAPHAHIGRLLYCFQSSDKQAVEILTTILPYLRIKRRSAECVLALRALKDAPEKVRVVLPIINRWGKTVDSVRWRLSDAHIQRCEELWKMASDINHGLI